LIFAPTLQATKYEILDQSFEFKTGGTVKIENTSGEVKVEVWAEELVHVTAKKVEPPNTPVALSDVAFFNTKSQINIKSQPVEKTSRVDLSVFVPRNTSLRIITASGAVQIRGAVSSALVETSAGNIKLESPPSQDADVVMTTTSGAIKAENIT
ncbi:MAG: von Willebrand factor type A domain-containing protein, partial [bacterium]